MVKRSRSSVGRSGDRGGRRRPQQGPQPPARKKVKRSKKFWQQRKTSSVRLVEDDEDARRQDAGQETGSETEEPEVSQFDRFLSEFSKGGAQNGSSLASSRNPQSLGETFSDDSEDGAGDEGASQDEDSSESGEDVADSLDGSGGDEDDNEDEESLHDDDDDEESLHDDDDDDDEAHNTGEASNFRGGAIQRSSSDSDVHEDEDDDEEAEEEPANEGVGIGTPDDPFVAKFELEIEPDLVEALASKGLPGSSANPFEMKHLGHCVLMRPDWKPAQDAEETSPKLQPTLLDDDDVEGVNDETGEAGGDQRHRIRQVQRKLVESLPDKQGSAEGFDAKMLRSQHFVKDSLSKNVVSMKRLSGLQQDLMSILSRYRDVIFNQRTFENGEELRTMYVLHALNHVLKSRSKVTKNNQKIARAKEIKNKKFRDKNVVARDQGLCRPKVLILVPFRDSARRVVQLLQDLLFGPGCSEADLNKRVLNRKRFLEDFGSGDEDLDQLISNGRKPEEYYRTFCGNTDDAFKLGIGVARKALKLYTEFYSSDIIVASPLGLRTVVGVEGEAKRDYDFLASLEILVVDQADVLAMQNWDHVAHIFDHLHLPQISSHGVDFSRVRMWALNQLARYYRQTVLISGVAMPELNAIFNKSCWNYVGKVRVSNPVPAFGGSICRVTVPQIPMVFRRFESISAASGADDRLEHFVSRIMPDYTQDLMYHTLIFVPSYFDFVRVRNWFAKKSDLDFAEVCEYTKYKKMAAARDRFFHGEHHFLLYTERAHFYKRYTVKGVRHVIFYQLPLQPQTFAEICNFMSPSYVNPKGGSDGNMSCTVLYNRFDVHRLSAVVGSNRAKTMLDSSKNTHMFVAGSS